MNAPAMDKTPLDYVAAAERERETGNHRQAAALMWQATQATFANLAGARNLDDLDLIELAKQLESDGSVTKYYYRGGLVGATLLRDHAAMDVLESYELTDAYEATRQFIRDCCDDQR